MNPRREKPDFGFAASGLAGSGVFLKLTRHLPFVRAVTDKEKRILQGNPQTNIAEIGNGGGVEVTACRAATG
jgi:hypothetical protein